MDPKNAQSGVKAGNYYVTNDTWNASHYGGLSQSLYVAVTTTGTRLPR